MLDLQHEQQIQGQQYTDLYDGVSALKKRYALHEVKALPRDVLAIRRDSEREQVQELVKRFRDIPDDHQKRLPALLNSLAQLELLIGEFDAAQQDFDEVAGLVLNHDERAEAHHNAYRAALEVRDWPEALAALLRACTLDPELYEPFPLARFEPRAILGGGALGVTFHCVEKGSGDDVIIKAIREDSLDRPVGLVLTEMQWLQDIDHAALLRIREHGYTDNNFLARPYVVFDYFQGITLAELVRREGPLDPEDAFAILWPIARVLQLAHNRGVLHRSLTPWSVLLCPYEADAEPPPEDFDDLDEFEDFEKPEDDSWEFPDDADEPPIEEFLPPPQESIPEPAAPPAKPWDVRLIETGLSVRRVVLHAAASSPAARAHTGLGRTIARSLPYFPSEVVGRPKGMVWVGPHSDVYSFGRLCCFALTGRADLPPEPSRSPQLEDIEADHDFESPGADTPPADGLRAAWLQLIRDCCSWVSSARPQHFGLVLNRLSMLPGAPPLVDASEEQSERQLLAQYTRLLQRNADDVRAMTGRAALHTQRGNHAAAIEDYSAALTRRPHDPALLRRRGQAHFDNGDLDAALVDLGRAIELEPRNLEGWSLRAAVHSRKGNHDAAIADYSEVIRQSPKDTAALFSRGNEYYSNADWSLAIGDYSRVLLLEPQNLWAFGNRGKCRANRGEHDKAIADFAALLRLDPGNGRARRDRGVSLLALDRYDEAIAEFTRGLESEPTAHLYNERGLAYAEHGEHDKAIADFSKAHEIDPENPYSIMYRGNSHCDQGDLDLALADLSKAVELGPSLAVAWYNRGNVHARLGQLDAAVADFTKAVELDPMYGVAWFNRGNAYADRGEHELAIADYTKALELDPSDGSALNNRGNSRASLNDLDAAMSDFNEAVRLAPHDTVARLNRANTLSRLGELEAALTDYDEVIRLEPRHSRALNNRGNIHYDRNERAAALADYTKAIEIDPGYARALNNRGDLLAEDGRLDEALADLTRAVEVEPDYTKAWHNRGNAEAALNRLDEALTSLTRAAELSPDDATVLVDRAAVRQRQGNAEAALADLGRAVEIDGQYATAWLARGNLHNERGDLDAAIADYTKAIEVAPGLLAAYHNRGRLLARRGEYQAAVADNLAALALDENNPRTLNNLAWLWATCPVVEQRDPVKAIAHATRACEQTGWTSAGYLDTLAVAFAANGQFEEAVRWQEKALELCGEEEKADYRSRLDLYRAGQPFRESCP